MSLYSQSVIHLLNKHILSVHPVPDSGLISGVGGRYRSEQKGHNPRIRGLCEEKPNDSNMYPEASATLLTFLCALLFTSAQQSSIASFLVRVIRFLFT